MDDTQKLILNNLADAVVDMDEAKAADSARQALAAGISAETAIMEGLSKGMDIVSQKYNSGEYFIPQLLVCSDAMYAGVDVLRPHLKAQTVEQRERVVIGVVEGDTHDIGKNIVKLMLEAANLDVIDLGRDVPLSDFVERAMEVDAKLICMSTLMTTTMSGMREVIEQLNEKGLNGSIKTLVGGGPVSLAYAQRIGADAYANDALAAVRTVKELLGG